MGKSIYQQICDNITEGILGSEFALYEEDPDDSGLKWAPGAMDGVSIYHMRHSGLDATQTKGMAKALKCAARSDFAETDALFYKWTKAVRAVSCIDELQNYVLDHARTLDAGNVFSTALSMVLHSTHVECVVLMSKANI